MNKSRWHEANKDHVRKYMQAYGRKWRANNRQKHRAASRKWYAANKGRVAATGHQRYERKRDGILRLKYGIGLKQYYAMLLEQGGACAICQTQEPGGRSKGQWHVDHCHTNKNVRGLLCDRCNRMLGYAKDVPAVLRAGASYLERGLDTGAPVM
jgi:hypothetical protein